MVAGGICWGVKSLAILVTGEQPPILFELAPTFFTAGLIGLYAGIPEKTGLAKAGAALATVGLAMSVVALVTTRFGFEETAEDEFSPAIFSTFLLVVSALAVLGAASRRQNVLSSTNWLPLGLAISFVPLLMVGGLLSALNERLLELPLLVIAVGWTALGYVMVRTGSAPAH
jgi:hypothetical protein